MAFSKLHLPLLIAGMVFLFSTTVPAQDGSHPGGPRKYPTEKGIDLRKPIGPGGLKDGFVPQGSGPSFGEGVSRPSVHVDVMTCYSQYYGFTFRETYTYSRKGDLLEMLLEAWDQDWFNYDRSLYTYDQKGNVLTETVAYWDGTNWIDYLLYTYTYDRNGLCTYLLYEDIYGGFTEKISMYYDNQKNKIKELGQFWDGLNWVNLELWTYTYNNQRDMLTMYGQQDFGAGWTDFMRETWVYLAKGKWLTDQVEYADAAGVLTNYVLYTNQYDKYGNRKSYTGSNWYDNEGWVVEFGGRFTYDNYHNMLSGIQSSYIYGLQGPYWSDHDSTANAYNYLSMQITGLGYIKENNQWVRGETEIYIQFYDVGNILEFADEYPSNKVVVKYSRAVPGVGDGDDPLATESPAATGLLNVTVSPNPVSGPFTITVNAPGGGNFEINLYNINGSLVQTIYDGYLKQGVNEIAIPSFPASEKGIYFVKVLSPEGSRAVKLILQ